MSSLACARCGAPLPPAAVEVAVACAFCGAASAPPPPVVEREVERVVERAFMDREKARREAGGE